MRPKKKFKVRDLLRKEIYNTYSYLSEEKVYCNTCDREIKTGHGHEKERLDEHKKSARHVELLSKRKFVQTSIVSMVNSNHANDFNFQLVKAFIEAGIPLSKVNHRSIKQLFEVRCNKKIYDRRHLTRKYIPVLFEESVNEVRQFVGENYVYFIIDETPDIKKRSVVDILVGILN